MVSLLCGQTLSMGYKGGNLICGFFFFCIEKQSHVNEFKRIRHGFCYWILSEAEHGDSGCFTAIVDPGN